MSKNLDHLESSWQDNRDTSGDKHDSLITSGKVNEERIKMALAIGHMGSYTTVMHVPELPEHYRTKIEKAISPLSIQEMVSFALDCAIRAFAAWEAIRATDRRPHIALEATRMWLLGQVTQEVVSAAARGASDAGREADDPDQVPANRTLTAAIYAADAASHAALAAEYAARLPSDPEVSVSDVVECVAWAAKFALSAAPDPQAEKKWQLEQLANYLLLQATPLWPRFSGS
jgi:hypothetical protein